jgi:hypothetical protein
MLLGDLFFDYWTEQSSGGHPSRTQLVCFKISENAGLVRTIYFQAKSFLLSPHEKFVKFGFCTLSGRLWPRRNHE